MVCQEVHFRTLVTLKGMNLSEWVMRKFLLKMNNLDNVLDDILVFSKNWKGNLHVLDELFSRFRNADLTVRPSKCFIGFRRLDCLGRVLDNNILHPDPGREKRL